MDTAPPDEDSQIETQQDEETYHETETHDDDPPEAQEPSEEVDAKAAGSKAKSKSAKEKEWEREPGKSLFPFSKVQKIIKADKARLLAFLCTFHGM